MINADDIELVVAQTDAVIIGSGYARIEKAKSFYKHSGYAYSGFMYVQPEYRGKGINNKIIGALQKWSLSQNINELLLEVYYDNVAAITAYKKQGFLNISLRCALA